MTYREMRELSYAGFGVFHDEAIIPAVLGGQKPSDVWKHPPQPSATPPSEGIIFAALVSWRSKIFQCLEAIRVDLRSLAVQVFTEKTVLKALNLRGGRISFFASLGENHEYEKDSHL
jgi:hypothetical protein